MLAFLICVRDLPKKLLCVWLIYSSHCVSTWRTCITTSRLVDNNFDQKNPKVLSPVKILFIFWGGKGVTLFSSGFLKWEFMEMDSCLE